MKFLLIGFLAFSIWSALSAYIYVCKIKGLCYVPISMHDAAVNPKEVIKSDTVNKPVVQDQAKIPKTLIIHFAFDKSEFISDSEADKYFDKSNAYLDQNSQAKLSITGFTDAIGSDEYNQDLGYRRAQTMQHYFEGKGMHTNKIIIESRGEKEPADDNGTSAGRAINRRTVINIKK